LIAIDVGNTNTGVGFFKAGKLIKKVFLKTRPGLVEKLEENIPLSETEAVYFSSVVPKYDSELQKMTAGKGIETVFINHRIKTALRIKIDNPEELGADRIVNANAGLFYYKPPFMVIDSGTATTFDLVDREYSYIGGVIFPGIDIALKSLSENTAKLKEIKFYKPDSPLGKNSADCMRAGLYYGYIGSLNYFIKLYKELLGEDTRVIVTGGLVSFLKGELDGVDLYLEDLIFYGIQYLFQRFGKI
jgi:type III pantothenate kinase